MIASLRTPNCKAIFPLAPSAFAAHSEAEGANDVERVPGKLIEKLYTRATATMMGSPFQVQQENTGNHENTKKVLGERHPFGMFLVFVWFGGLGICQKAFEYE